MITYSFATSFETKLLYEVCEVFQNLAYLLSQLFCFLMVKLAILFPFLVPTALPL